MAINTGKAVRIRMRKTKSEAAEFKEWVGPTIKKWFSSVSCTTLADVS